MGRFLEKTLARVRQTPFSAVMIALAVLLWVPSVAFGVRVLLRYANTPGRLATPSPVWPGDMALQPAGGRTLLVVFAHPRCPCTRATIAELAWIMARCRGKLDAHVLFYTPQSANRDWAKSALWRDAAAIPGVDVMADPDGRQARRFGASTSGQTLLYSSSGRLLFNGGITISRGHAGPNDGRDAIVSLVVQRTARQQKTAVFGCSIRGGA